MNLYYEQNLLNRKYDTIARKNKTSGIVRTIMLGIAFMLIMSNILVIGTEGAWIVVLVLLGASVPFIAVFFVITRIMKLRSTEYDYVINDNLITITAVFFRDARKVKYKINNQQISLIGQYGSDAYKRAENLASKKQYALVNYDDEQAIAFILYTDNKGEKNILFFEPSKDFISALRRAISKYEVFDSSVKDLSFHAQDTEGFEMGAPEKRTVSALSDDSKIDDAIDGNEDETLDDTETTKNESITTDDKIENIIDSENKEDENNT